MGVDTPIGALGFATFESQITEVHIYIRDISPKLLPSTHITSTAFENHALGALPAISLDLKRVQEEEEELELQDDERKGQMT
ncbi:1072_t:CDS:2 [Acaulospora colombiana]|uniref:1072_t:CDS:1 n=1 Tax=Acaulospora colombiana TaxID=27376 RepID=A0ACA9R0W7_9GLOM|nr:1072_t:CDS:2 [Acaulospora colombiana]